MEKKDRYRTMGQYVHDHKSHKLDMTVEEADIIRSAAIEIASQKSVNVRFKKRYKTGPRNGKSAIQLPVWVWEQAFENQK